MPIYEYRCRDCDTVTNVFFRSVSAAEADAACGRCGSSATERLISRTFVVKGTASRIDEYDANRALGSLNGMDSGSFARWARRMSSELGESAGGERFRDLAERAEAGDDPVERVDPGHTLRYELSQRRESDSGGLGGGDAAAAGAE